MALKLKIKTVKPEPVGVSIEADFVSPAKPDAGEARMRVVDMAEIDFLKAGLTYTLAEEADWTNRARKWLDRLLGVA